jgi:hypothetical protein
VSGNGRKTGVVASFEHLDSLLAAIRAVRAAGHTDLTVFSPVPCEEVDKLLMKPKSPVRYITFLGAVGGFLGAFVLTILSSLIWSLIVGGKPIISIPPFLVPVFELTILLGGLATLAAVLYFGRLPARRSEGFRGEFTDDRFGLFVEVPREPAESVRALLKEHHAERTWLEPEEGGER